MSSQIIAFLPCRAGSQRVVQKNTRPFAGIQGGLLMIKLQQLVRVSAIDKIIVSTDDPVVMEFTESIIKTSDKPISIDERPAHLASSSTSTDALIEYIPSIIQDGIVLWTHVTSPFVDEEVYSTAISRFTESYEAGLNDSLMSVTKLQVFLWDQNAPVNYDRAVEKWPRTQTLPVWYEVNSAIFMAPISVYHELHDRIGSAPFIFPLEFPGTIDIDEQDQFELAELAWLSLRGRTLD